MRATNGLNSSVCPGINIIMKRDKKEEQRFASLISVSVGRERLLQNHCTVGLKQLFLLTCLACWMY